LPTEVVSFALSDCFPEELPEMLDQELLFNNFFIPWFLFNWVPFEDFDIDQFDPEITISQNYVKKYGWKLNSAEKKFIEAMNRTYYSFYSVLEIEIEKSIVVKDIMLGTTHKIKERQGTYQLKRGDLVFSRILTMDNQSIFIGMAPFIIPTGYHHNLIRFREWLIKENNYDELNAEILRNELDVELCAYFIEKAKLEMDK